MKTIVILSPNNPGSYFRAIATRMVRIIREAGYRPFVSDIIPDDVSHHVIAGVLGLIHPKYESVLRKMKCPVVNISQAHGPLVFPSVLPDNIEAGRLAAEHLIERCYTTLVYVPRGDLTYSVLRGEGVRTAAHEAGIRFEPWQQQETGTSAPDPWEPFLNALPKPAGLVAADDTVAAAILQAASAIHIEIPDQLAVVGITNDSFACETSAIPLSSVDLNPDDIGDRAAHLLLHLMSGGRPPKKPILIPPLGVMVRASSDAFATSNPLITSMVRHVRQHLTEGVRVDDLAHTFKISHSHLRRVFNQSLGFPPAILIQHVAVERAKQLLSTSTLGNKEIATQCGYEQVSHFGVMFRKLTGTTPAVYRNSRRSSVNHP